MNLSLSTSQLPSMTGQGGRDLHPVPISTQYGFTPQNMPKVTCHFHPQQTIRYFCKEALMPLCAECVPGHKQEQNQLGNRTNIVPLEASLTEVYSKMSNQANEIVYHYEQLMETNNDVHFQTIGDKKSLLTNPVSLINSARNQVHSIVDNYFNTLETFIRARIPEGQRKAPDVSREISDLKNRWDFCVQDLEVLNSKDCLQQLIHFYQGETNDQTEKLIGQAKRALNQQRNSIQQLPSGLDIPQLNIDPLYLTRFLGALERYAYFVEPPYDQSYNVPFPPPREMNYNPQYPSPQNNLFQQYPAQIPLYQYPQQLQRPLTQQELEGEHFRRQKQRPYDNLIQQPGLPQQQYRQNRPGMQLYQQPNMQNMAYQ